MSWLPYTLTCRDTPTSLSTTVVEGAHRGCARTNPLLKTISMSVGGLSQCPPPVSHKWDSCLTEAQNLQSGMGMPTFLPPCAIYPPLTSLLLSSTHHFYQSQRTLRFLYPTFLAQQGQVTYKRLKHTLEAAPTSVSLVLGTSFLTTFKP